MAVYAYKATDASMAGVEGTLVADSPRHARDTLRDRGLTVLRVASQEAREGTSFVGGLSGRRHAARLPDFLRDLSALLGVGVPLIEALDTLIKQYRTRRERSFRGVLLALRDRVAGGASFAQAMREQPGVFDEMCVNLAEVGEDAGNLDAALAHLADYRERARQLRSKVGSALLYPAVVLLTGVAVSVFLMTFVVPNLLESLVEAGKPLPTVTLVVKWISDLLLHRWWLIITLVGLAGLGVAAGLATPRGRALWHRVQLHLPLVGDLLRKQAIARVATVTATLLRSGVVFLRAIEVAARSAKNETIAAALLSCRDRVHAGAEIADALEATGVFRPVVIQVFAVGQQSGKLEEMLEQLAKSYDAQVTSATARLTALLEPALILCLALIVGFIAFATILPILEAGHVL